jgi:hypothetical protein
MKHFLKKMVYFINNLLLTLSGMDRDYGPGSYGGLAFKDIYLKILLLSASKGEQHLIFFFLNSYRAGS